MTTNPNLSLRLAAPLLFSVCWGFAVFNTLLGLVFITVPTAFLLPHLGWMVVFSGIGLAGGIFLVRNDWRLTRLILVGGLLVKAMWFIYLLQFITKGAVSIVLLWLFLAYIQALAVIYFPRRLP